MTPHERSPGGHQQKTWWNVLVSEVARSTAIGRVISHTSHLITRPMVWLTCSPVAAPDAVQFLTGRPQFSSNCPKIRRDACITTRSFISRQHQSWAKHDRLQWRLWGDRWYGNFPHHWSQCRHRQAQSGHRCHVGGIRAGKLNSAWGEQIKRESDDEKEAICGSRYVFFTLWTSKGGHGKRINQG